MRIPRGRNRNTDIVRDPAAQAAAVAEASVVDGWPADPEVHLHEIVDDLDRSEQLIVFDAEFDHYKGGFASFVEVRLTRRDGSLVVTRDEEVETTGFGLLLSRFAPIAALQAKAYVSRSGHTMSARSLPGPEALCPLPVPGFPESPTLVGILRRHGYEVVAPNDLRRPIAAGLEPMTNLGIAPWTVFDAWFYWYD